jgi:LysM repeat protein
MKLIHTIYLAAALSTACVGLQAQTSGSGYFLHTVAQGQSVYSIANMYGVKVADIIRLNPGSDEKIRTGATLKIPQADGAKQKFHTIQSGETLYQLTVRYGVSASRICAANPGLSASNFRAGQVIAIPTATADDARQEGEAVARTASASQGSAASTTASGSTSASAKKGTQHLASQTRYRDIHQVEKKETIYSISRLYGITEEELIEANPELRTEKLKKGQFVGIPYAKGTPGLKTGTGTQGTAGTSAASTSPTNDELFSNNKKSARRLSTLKVGVMLPFMTEATGSREEQTRMVEYYEGFLMAVDSLKSRGVNIDLYAYDTGKDAASLQAVLAKSELKDMHLIFGPGYSSHIKPVADFARKHDIRLVVPFTSKNEEVFNNPSIFQINTPQSYLYTEVYEHFTRKFRNCQVIFLDPDMGDRNKQEFVSGLKAELKGESIPYKELKGEDITPENLRAQMSRVLDNVFVPTSGQNTALIKLLPQLIVTLRDNPDYRIKLFGYPEWQTYTSDHLSNFYELDTYFYTSFYTNNLFPAAVRFGSAYRKWYSKDLSNTYPQYSMLGFDTGYFFLKALADYGTDFEEKMNDMKVTPIQTGFKFERVGTWGGFVNRKVFFVHFTKDYELMKLDFE